MAAGYWASVLAYDARKVRTP